MLDLVYLAGDLVLVAGLVLGVTAFFRPQERLGLGVRWHAGALGAVCAGGLIIGVLPRGAPFVALVGVGALGLLRWSDIDGTVRRLALAALLVGALGTVASVSLELSAASRQERDLRALRLEGEPQRESDGVVAAVVYRAEKAARSGSLDDLTAFGRTASRHANGSLDSAAVVRAFGPHSDRFRAALGTAAESYAAFDRSGDSARAVRSEYEDAVRERDEAQREFEEIGAQRPDAVEIDLAVVRRFDPGAGAAYYHAVNRATGEQVVLFARDGAVEVGHSGWTLVYPQGPRPYEVTLPTPYGPSVEEVWLDLYAVDWRAGELAEIEGRLAVAQSRLAEARAARDRRAAHVREGMSTIRSRFIEEALAAARTIVAASSGATERTGDPVISGPVGP